MGKKKNSKLRKEREAAKVSLLFPIFEIPKVKHPNEEQEDPINGKFPKNIELSPWGPEWR